MPTAALFLGREPSVDLSGVSGHRGRIGIPLARADLFRRGLSDWAAVPCCGLFLATFAPVTIIDRNGRHFAALSPYRALDFDSSHELDREDNTRRDEKDELLAVDSPSEQAKPHPPKEARTAAPLKPNGRSRSNHSVAARERGTVSVSIFLCAHRPSGQECYSETAEGR